MIESMPSNAPVAGRDTVAFAGNWLGGAGGKGARRRLFAVLRLAHRSLGMNRRKLGLGALGAGRIAAFLVSLGIASTPASIALAQYAAGPANTTGEGADAVQIGGNGGTAPIAGGASSVAIGNGALVAPGINGDQGIAIGYNATVSGTTGAVAIGPGSESITLGNGGTAASHDGVAIGTGAQANTTAGNQSSPVALGDGTIATGAASQVAIGDTATASGFAAIAIGGVVGNISAKTQSTGAYSIALGSGTTASAASAIAIGGAGQTTGIGPGPAASGAAIATAVNAIAIGATAAASYTNGVAVGAESTAAAVNSTAFGAFSTAVNAGDVALGSNSITAAAVTTTGATIAGLSYAFAGTGPSSTVSVGQPGAERTITNVAAGQISASSTDAINGSELYATNSAVGLLSGQVTNQGNTTAANFGAGSTFNPITGNVSAPTYTIAGSAYNNVGSALNAITGGSPYAGVQYFHANSAGTDSLALGTNSVAIGQSAVANNAGDVALGLGSTTAATVATSSATIAGTSYAFAGTTPTSTVSVGSAAAPRTITNVAAGQITASSTDAINGSELYATDSALGTLASNAVLYNSAAKTGVTLGGAGATTPVSLTNVAAGSLTPTSTAAVNGSQINTLGTSVANNFGGGSTFNTTTGAVTSPTYTISVATYNNVGSALNAITGGSSNAGVKYFHANSVGTDSSAIGANAVAIGQSAVANGAGSIAAGLGATTTATGDLAIGLAAKATGNAAGAATSIGAANTATGAGAVAIGDPNVATGQGAVAMGFNNTATGTGAVALGSASTAAGPGSLAFGANAIAANAGDVALGSGSTTAAAVATSSATIAGISFAFAGTNPTSTVSVGFLGGARTITNVAAGQITASSTDAVNGSELYATDQAIANLSGVNSVLYDGSGKTSVTLGGVGSTTPVSLTNVAAGSLTPTSTAAVNGSQINTLGTSVANNFGGGSTFNTTTGAVTSPSYTIAGTTYNNVGSALNAITGGSSTAGVKYFHANSEGTDSVALGVNAVAIGQSAVATNAGDVALGFNSVTSAAVATATETIGGTTYAFAGTTPTSTVSVGSPGAERTITNVAAGQITASSTDAINGSELYATDQAIATLSGVNSVLYDNAGKTSVTLGGVGATAPVALTNVAAGSLTSTSTDAVNGGQINTLGTSIANNFGGGSTFNSTTGTVTAPTYTVAGNTYNNVGSALNAITGGSSSAGVKYFHANSTGPDSVATGENAVAIGQSAVATNTGDVALGAGATTTAAIATAGATILGIAYAFAGTAPTSTVSVGAPGAERTITNVAAGQITASSTDAVNGSELFAVTQAVATGSVGPVQYANAATPTTPNGGVPSQNLTLVGAAAAPVTLSNVAPGLLSPTSTQAVNGAQLYATNQVANNSVQYDDPTHSSVTLGGTTSLTPVKLHNVAAGTATTDAVNLGQLNTGLNNTLAAANNYTDQQIALLNFNLGQLRRDAAAGAAGGLAAAGLPQAYSPGRSLVSAGVGAFAGEAAMAFGVSRVFDDGHTIIKAGVTYDSQGQVGGNAGIGYQW